jgi:hypothetical protein
MVKRPLEQQSLLTKNRSAKSHETTRKRATELNSFRVVSCDLVVGQVFLFDLELTLNRGRPLSKVKAAF